MKIVRVITILISLLGLVTSLLTMYGIIDLEWFPYTAFWISFVGLGAIQVYDITR